MQRRQFDWEAIEREYRAGQLSIKEIARQHGCSRGAIQKNAKKNGWKRDLSEQIRREMRAKLASSGTEGSTLDTAGEQEVISQGAELAVAVVREHRKVIGKTFKMAEDLLTAAKKEKLQAGPMSNVFRAVTQGLAKVIPLERQAFNIDEQPSETIAGGLEQLMDAIGESRKRGLPNQG